jgi:hypothetical protein
MNSRKKWTPQANGPVEISLLPNDDESGSVLLGLKTEDISLEILVTRAGRVRLYVPAGGMVMVEAAAGGTPALPKK